MSERSETQPFFGKTPIRKRRPGTRRGDPTPEEKHQIRLDAYGRAQGQCEIRAEKYCTSLKGILPLDGDVLRRAHLVHLRAKRRFGWGMGNVCIGCSACHRAAHDGKVTLPKTYAELKPEPKHFKEER